MFLNSDGKFINRGSLGWLLYGLEKMDSVGARRKAGPWIGEVVCFGGEVGAYIG